MTTPAQQNGCPAIPEVGFTGLQGADHPATPTEFHLGYRRWLDGLRGVAVLLVLACHLGFVAGGFLGVDVFFVLSGFLITTLLVEEWQRRGSISLKHFYLRRALRLWPAFFTLLLICGLAGLLFLSTAEAAALRPEMLVAACYVTNWPALHHVGMPTLGHTWSLSVEEQFYLLWPVLLYGMLRLRLPRRRILLLVCAGIVASASFRLVWYRLHSTPASEKAAAVARLYLGLDSRGDALLVGCLVGLLAAWRLLPTSRRFISGTGVAALASAAALGYLVVNRCLDHAQFYHGLFTGVALMVAAILVRMLSAPSRLGSWLLESAPLVGVGRLSYALYLFHVPIIAWLRPPRGLGWRNPADTLLVAGLSLAAAVLSYYGIERPCLRLKQRFHARNPVPAASAAPRADQPDLPPRAAA